MKEKFGLRQFLIWGGVIFLFVLIAVFYTLRLTHNWPAKENNKPKDENKEVEDIPTDLTYEGLEINLENAAIDYISYEYPNGMDTGSKTVYAKTLIDEELLYDFVDPDDGTTCTGYAIVLQNEDFELRSMPYIKCTGYKTDGFSEYR